MTRINRQDTLLTELRDIKRRLRLLEAGRMRPPTAPAVTGTEAPPPPTTPVPLTPARPRDWPGTASSEWEPLFTARGLPDQPSMVVELHLAAEPGTAGAVRVRVDGQTVHGPMPVTDTPSARTLTVSAGSEITVEARRSQGTGTVRVWALRYPS